MPSINMPKKSHQKIFSSLQLLEAREALLHKELEVIRLQQRKKRYQIERAYAKLVRTYLLDNSRKLEPVEQVEAKLQELLENKQHRAKEKTHGTEC